MTYLLAVLAACASATSRVLRHKADPGAPACERSQPGGMIEESAFLIGLQPPGQAPRKAIRLRDGLVVVLALTTGAVDVVTYLRLGKVFSGVIAGNLALLAVAAAAMGMQATAVRRLGPMSTTYLTSTLTGLLQALAIRRWPSEWQRSTGVLLAFVIGAVLGGLAVLRAPAAVPAAVLVPLAAVVARTLPAAVNREPGGG